jgi:hypothetical protein
LLADRAILLARPFAKRPRTCRFTDRKLAFVPAQKPMCRSLVEAVVVNHLVCGLYRWTKRLKVAASVTAPTAEAAAGVTSAVSEIETPK